VLRTPHDAAPHPNHKAAHCRTRPWRGSFGNGSGGGLRAGKPDETLHHRWGQSDAATARSTRQKRHQDLPRRARPRDDQGSAGDSVLELRFHHGPGRWLPEYQYQYPVRFEGKNYRLDFAYPEVKVGIEVDGYEKRTSMESLTHDARKTTALMKAGWTVPHFTWPDVKHDPQKVVNDTLALLRDAGYMFRR
jgi:very-short-patch-repair endonuclease